MVNKDISIRLSTKGIDEALKEIEKYKQDFLRKVDLYRKRLANEISKEASFRFAGSGVNDVVHGGTRKASVMVTVSDNGKISMVIANGEDAVWCEFGAGVYHNGGVGSSPNPYGSELGLTIGGYGKGHGKQDVWGYYENPGDPSTLVLTHGTAATMPMYRAVQSIVPKAVSIAREVFS